MLTATIRGYNALACRSGTQQPRLLFGSAKSFSQWFVDARKEAGLHMRCVPHGVRKGSGTIARKNGASNAELRSIYGWTSDKMVEHYTGGAINAEMAAGALHYLSPKKKEQKTYKSD